MDLFKRFAWRAGIVVVMVESLLLVAGVAALIKGPPPVKSSLTRVAQTSKPAAPSPAMRLSTAEKAGRMVCFGVDSQAEAVQIARDNHVGCFLLSPGGDLYSKQATDAIRSAAGMRVLFAIDEEGGSVSRLGADQFKSDTAEAMGQMAASTVRSLGLQMGGAIRAIGANVDFAPVLDISDPNNQAIGYYGRAFSSDPSVITRAAGAFAGGLRDAGVIPTFKHFPGLGRATGPTDGNTDTGSATAPNIASLRANDLLPYQNLLPGPDTTAVMVGNQIVPGLTGGQPASISSGTYALLRSDYHFQGVVFTDSLSAAAITDPAPEAVVRALAAGADLPLVSVKTAADATAITQAIDTAITKGILSQKQVDQTLSRIEALRGTLPQS